MNSQIDQLAESALESLDEDVERILTRIDGICPEFLNKCAELIIKNCVSTLESLTVPESNSFSDWDYGYNKAIHTGSKVILQQFELSTNYEQ